MKATLLSLFAMSFVTNAGDVQVSIRFQAQAASTGHERPAL
jgi:hypothetical protein